VIKRNANGGRNIQTWLHGYQYNPVIPSKATTFICNTMCFKGWCLGNSSSTTYETEDLLRKHGGKTKKELKAAGN